MVQWTSETDFVYQLEFYCSLRVDLILANMVESVSICWLTDRSGLKRWRVSKRGRVPPLAGDNLGLNAENHGKRHAIEP